MISNDRAVAFMLWLKDNHCGQENAVNAKRISQWGNNRDIRFMVHDLRRQGVPICSGNEGYYYASNSREIGQTLAFLNSIQDDLSKVIRGLNDALEDMKSAE